jgi:hypothetical protein
VTRAMSDVAVKAQIAEDAAFLKTLGAAINAEYDLTPAQWALWYAVALGFRPDLIVVLGRSKGNSTALFCQAAWRLGRMAVKSLCNSKDWTDESLPKITPLVPARWLDALDARVTDIRDVDYPNSFSSSATTSTSANESSTPVSNNDSFGADVIVLAEMRWMISTILACVSIAVARGAFAIPSRVVLVQRRGCLTLSSCAI